MRAGNKGHVGTVACDGRWCGRPALVHGGHREADRRISRAGQFRLRHYPQSLASSGRRLDIVDRRQRLIRGSIRGGWGRRARPPEFPPGRCRHPRLEHARAPSLNLVRITLGRRRHNAHITHSKRIFSRNSANLTHLTDFEIYFGRTRPLSPPRLKAATACEAARPSIGNARRTNRARSPTTRRDNRRANRRSPRP